MTDREKLNDLFADGKCPAWFVDNKQRLDVVDYLIANGVTVGKDTNVPTEWRPASEPPKENGLYITYGCTAVPVRWLHCFDKDVGKFGAWWDYEPDGTEHPRYRFIEAENITHWMPLPQLPKEVE